MKYVAGKNIVCSMGTSNTALFLQRSGIGPSNVLAAAGIPMQVNSPFIGQNLLNQYGPGLHITTTNPAFGQGFPAWSYVQYNGVPRRFTFAVAGFGSMPFGVEMQAAIDTTVYHFFLLCYMDQPRSRGYINVLSSNLNRNPNINMGWYTDGPNPNDPASVLVVNGGSADSDIQSACVGLDLVSNIVSYMQYYYPNYNIKIGPEYNPAIFSPVVPGVTGSGVGTAAYQLSTQATRFPQMVPYVTMYNLPQSHEAGTVIMGSSPSTGACDGNLKLYGTSNVFALDKSIFPVQLSSGPLAVLQAIGVNAASIIPTVALP